jgi:hypothetical protein
MTALQYLHLRDGTARVQQLAPAEAEKAEELFCRLTAFPVQLVAQQAEYAG